MIVVLSVDIFVSISESEVRYTHAYFHAYTQAHILIHKCVFKAENVEYLCIISASKMTSTAVADQDWLRILQKQVSCLKTIFTNGVRWLKLYV